MNSAHNFITVNNPNVPILSPTGSSSTPFGQFLSAPFDERNTFEETVAQVQCHDMYLPNFSIRASKGVFHHNARLVNCDNEGLELLGSCIFLQGTISSLRGNKPEGVDGYAGSQNFKYDPHNEYTHVVAADTAFHLLHFTYTYDYFSKFLPEDERWADTLKAKIENKERILGDRVIRLTACQQQALQNIFNCPLEGKFGYLLIETSIVQLILIQLHELFRVDHSTALGATSKRDKALMEEIKDYLSETFLDDHSIANLSKRFGVNTNKLMALFKSIFKQSIFEYIGTLRMQHARELILEHDMLVIEAARTIGYKNPNHFSAAFKKHFGVNPSKLK
jgi:AraC-like DNA-binding protein